VLVLGAIAFFYLRANAPAFMDTLAMPLPAGVLHAARLMLWDAAMRDERGEDARQAASMAKLYCTERSFQAVDRAVQVLGGMGLSREMPLEHWFRGLRVTRIIEGPSEVHRMLLARALLGESSLDKRSDSKPNSSPK
jgi:hypothetical protein